ncbi:tannase-domain-containing protein [Aureobasidium pullulans]|nr:tannase-domain-containing protein [Aureobasidium pullulans]
MVHFISIGQLINSIFHISGKGNAGSAAAAASTVQAAASSSAIASFSSSAIASSISTFTASAIPTSIISSLSTSIVTSSSTAIAISSSASVAAATSTSAAVANSTTAAQAVSGCDALIQALTFPDQQVTVVSCEDITSGTALTLPTGPSNCNGGSVQTDLRRVTLNIVTSYASSNYVEVWLPTGQDAWNGRFMATDNKGLSGCPSYDDMIYTSSLGFAVVGDNGGHNNTEYLGMDAQQFLNNNEVVIDWSYRARHAAVVAGKQVIKTNYGQAASYNYMLGCSNGGRQALQSAQMFPDDFDGIISGSSTNDFNHHMDWSGRMYVLTGADSSDSKFLSYDDWVIVHDEVLAQCDEPLDGVADGIIEDSTICDFNATKLTCTDGQTDGCLTYEQTSTVWNVFSQLYDQDGNLLYPRLAPGAELYASTNGVLHGVQGHVTDWFGDGFNNTSFDPSTLSQTEYTLADDDDELHGKVSSFNSDLSAFQAAGKKLIMYHGLMDPAVSAEASQRYYLNVARDMDLDHTGLDEFLRFFRISGMYHCTGGIGAWAFGQNINAQNGTGNVITDIMNWVENGEAPDTMTGTKFVNDDPTQGVQMERNHCRFPYRTTYNGSGDSTDADNWSCELINDWQECGVYNVPRLC